MFPVASIRPLTFLAAAAALGCHSAARADGDAGAGQSSSPWGLGLAVMAETLPYRDFDDETKVIPFFTYENRRIRVAGPGIRLQHTALLDVRGELIEGVPGEISSRVVCILVQHRHGHHHRSAVVDAELG